MAYPTYIPNYGSYNPGGPYNVQQPLYSPQMQSPAQPVNALNTQPQAAQGLSGASRLVSSREEAVGVPADFGGSLMLFPDITHNRIYTKRWNMQTGAAEFIEFAPVVPEPVEAAPAVEYATASDVNDIRQYLDELREEITRLKNRGKVVKRVDTNE